MAKEEHSHSEMARARWNDGINVIFDQKSPASSRSSSRSSCSSDSSSESDRYRDHGHRRRRHCSSSSSSSRSRSASRTRSRSRPRCNRPSPRCRCDNHRRYRRAHHRRSHPYRVRTHSSSFSRSPSPDRYSRRRSYRSRSRSSSRGHRRTVSSYRTRFSRSPASSYRTRFSRSPASSYRSRSRSRSSRSSLNLSLADKRELLMAGKANAAEILGVENLQLPESVKPNLLEQFQSERLSPNPEARVRQAPEKTLSKSHEVESDTSNPMTTTKKKEISFSINNSVARPIVAAPSTAKVTSRVDSFERRKPYGHWVPIKSSHFC